MQRFMALLISLFLTISVAACNKKTEDKKSEDPYKHMMDGFSDWNKHRKASEIEHLK